ncbi:MAG TPA: NADH-quinone oxidoreductase subunit A [Armatimonadetes bacterium]|nr:NADH-quinone oxidoreductase subunit A [Armatimonadota bacterium]
MPAWIADYWYVALFLLIGIGIVAGTLAFAWLLRPYKPSPDKYIPYECGVRPIGHARIQLRIIFYLVALLFVIFDIEALFLFPWGVAFRTLINKGLGLFAWVDMMLFLAILLWGWLYAYRKRVLDW